MSNISDVMHIAAAGLRAQSARMRIIAENVANASSTGETAGADPYRRQLPVFESDFDRAMGVELVRMTKAVPDASDFTVKYEPGHPAADGQGYVRYPNVSSLTEMMDMRAAQRAYEANINMIETSRSMTSRALDLLRR